MATTAGTYLVGDPIIVTYQAVACATGKTITMTVYGEDHLDAEMGGALAEIGATGRYWKAFTPDAEGEWIVTITNTTDGGGDVVKAFAVTGHSIDEIGDMTKAIDDLTKAAGNGDLAAMKVILDAESGVMAAVGALHDFDPANDAVAVVTALTGHTAQTGDSFAIVNGASGLVALKTLLDAVTAAGPTKAEMDTAHALLATVAKQDVTDAIIVDIHDTDLPAVKTVADAIQAKTDNIPASPAPASEYDTQLDQNLSTTEANIRGVENDTLKTLSEQLDAVSAPAMVG